MDKMDNVWERIKKGLKDGAALSMEKIEEYTKIGKLKIEEMATKRKIERNFLDIGERVFDLMGEGKTSGMDGDLIIRKAVDNIKGLRQDLKAIEEKIKMIQEEAKKAHGGVGEDEDAVGGI